MLTDFVKIFGLIIVLYIAYTFIQSHTNGTAAFNFNNIFHTHGSLVVTDKELWGTPSPYKGMVSIDPNSTPTATQTKNEYIKIIASPANTKPINLTGWSVRSLVSQTRMYFPPGTLLLKMTGRNTQQPVYLAPGEYAILHSGTSPIISIASSFHTNVCIGYLSQYHTFTPPLTSTCNNPKNILPATPQNITTYGAQCIEFLHNAQNCTSYTTQMPTHLLPACRDVIARKLTYHACLTDALQHNGYDAFNNGGWYLYLNHNAEIWRNTYEAIQLLDENGLVVDVLRY